MELKQRRREEGASLALLTPAGLTKTIRERPRPAGTVFAALALLFLFAYSKYSRTEMRLAAGAPALGAAMPFEEASRHCAANGWRPRAKRPLVYSMTAFRNELDMLELRLHELDGVVDYHVVMESTITHSGKPKELVFEQHKGDARFARFADRIIHVVENNTRDQAGEAFTDAHARESSQRSALVRGLDAGGARPDDLVVFSDLDEIPRADYLSVLAACEGYGFPVTVHTPEYLYDFGCRMDGDSWTRLKVVQRRHLRAECGWSASEVCPHDLRDDQAFRLGLFQVYPPPLVLHEGGWHLTWFMGVEQMLDKLAAYSHPERNTAQNRDPRFLECLRRRCVHVNKVDRGRRADPDATGEVFPRWIQEGRAGGGGGGWGKFFVKPGEFEGAAASANC